MISLYRASSFAAASCAFCFSAVRVSCTFFRSLAVKQSSSLLSHFDACVSTKSSKDSALRVAISALRCPSLSWAISRDSPAFTSFSVPSSMLTLRLPLITLTVALPFCCEAAKVTASSDFAACTVFLSSATSNVLPGSFPSAKISPSFSVKATSFFSLFFTDSSAFSFKVSALWPLTFAVTVEPVSVSMISPAFKGTFSFKLYPTPLRSILATPLIFFVTTAELESPLPNHPLI